MLKEIIHAVFDNSKKKIKDPIIGTFLGTWIFCNWDKIALLFYGVRPFDERILMFNKSFTYIWWYEDGFYWLDMLSLDLDIFILPIIFTYMYLFLLPRFLEFILKITNKYELVRYKETIKYEVNKVDEEIQLAEKQYEKRDEYISEKAMLKLKREDINLAEREQEIIKKEENTKKLLERAEYNEHVSRTDEHTVNVQLESLKKEESALSKQLSIIKNNNQFFDFKKFEGEFKSFTDPLTPETLTKDQKEKLKALVDIARFVFQDDTKYQYINKQKELLGVHVT